MSGYETTRKFIEGSGQDIPNIEGCLQTSRFTHFMPPVVVHRESRAISQRFPDKRQTIHSYKWCLCFFPPEARRDQASEPSNIIYGTK